MMDNRTSLRTSTGKGLLSRRDINTASNSMGILSVFYLLLMLLSQVTVVIVADESSRSSNGKNDPNHINIVISQQPAPIPTATPTSNKNRDAEQQQQLQQEGDEKEEEATKATASAKDFVDGTASAAGMEEGPPSPKESRRGRATTGTNNIRGGGGKMKIDAAMFVLPLVVVQRSANGTAIIVGDVSYKQPYDQYGGEIEPLLTKYEQYYDQVEKNVDIVEQAQWLTALGVAHKRRSTNAMTYKDISEAIDAMNDDDEFEGKGNLGPYFSVSLSSWST